MGGKVSLPTMHKILQKIADISARNKVPYPAHRLMHHEEEQLLHEVAVGRSRVFYTF